MANFQSKRFDDLMDVLRDHLDEAVADHLHEALNAYGPALLEAGLAWTTVQQRTDDARHFVDWLEGRYPLRKSTLVSVGNTEH